MYRSSASLLQFCRALLVYAALGESRILSEVVLRPLTESALRYADIGKQLSNFLRTISDQYENDSFVQLSDGVGSVNCTWLCCPWAISSSALFWRHSVPAQSACPPKCYIVRSQSQTLGS